jgi:aldose 1-epimerase
VTSGIANIEVGASAPVEPPTGWQYVLERPGQRAVVTEVGAALRAWRVGGRELLDGFDVGSPGDSFRGKVLAPWPNRLRDGRYGDERLAITEPERSTALHGVVLWVNWRPLRRTPESVTLGYVLHPQPGYPFTLALEVAYTLSDSGLEGALRARNLGAEPAPFGAGFHPCLTVGDASVDNTRLELPARARVPVDDRLLPTGPPVPLDGAHDFRRLRPVGATGLDTCFADLARGADGLARTRLLAGDGGRAVMLWMDAGFDFLHVYTGDDEPDPARRRRGITLEPMTCAPDAFNTGEGLRVLEPGAEFAGRWGLIG